MHGLVERISGSCASQEYDEKDWDEDREVLVFHIRDGKVVEGWQYIQNQYTYDEFFS